jgi:hypothetical protein
VQLAGARVSGHSSLLTAIWTGNSNLPEEDSCNVVVDNRNCRAQSISGIFTRNVESLFIEKEHATRGSLGIFLNVCLFD